MAAADPTETKGDSFEDAVSSNSLFRIRRAARIESASPRQKGRYHATVGGQQPKQHRARHGDQHPLRGDRRINARPSSLPMTLPGRPAALLRAITRKSVPICNAARRRRKTSRTCRLIRLRITALPTLPLTVIPSRDCCPSFLPVMTTKFADWSFAPARDNFKNSARFSRRAVFGNCSVPFGVIRSFGSAPCAFGWHTDRQSFSSFGAAPFEYFAPARCLHAGEKTVRAFSPNVARLIGSFHRNIAPLGGLSAKCLYQSYRPDVVNFSRPPPSKSVASGHAPPAPVFFRHTTPRAFAQRSASLSPAVWQASAANGYYVRPRRSCVSRR